MFRKLRRQNRRNQKQSQLTTKSCSANQLRLENLESRVLLDTSGWWTELGWRGASGGGITWNVGSLPSETEITLTADGDPIVFWTEGNIETDMELVDNDPIPYRWQQSGEIYARQYVNENLGWWDITNGGGDVIPIGIGMQLDAASGPDGEVVLSYIDQNGALVVQSWNGAFWGTLGTIDSFSAGKPSIAISESGEVFVSYTDMHPITNQREIVVKKFAFNYDDDTVTVPTLQDRSWVELIDEDTGLFGGASQLYGGVSATDGESFDSSIAIDLDGRPVVVWSDAVVQTNTEIFLKKWDGSVWEELGENSASFDSDGNAGISVDATMSVQPDIAITAEGEIVVTWVNWNNWENFSTDGQAGIYVKTLRRPNSDVWEAYDLQDAGINTIATTGAGIAQDSDLTVLDDGGVAPGLGWYFTPELQLNSQGNPFIVWQGLNPDEGPVIPDTSPELENDPTIPYEPRITGQISVYASYYQNGEFKLLYDPDNTWLNASQRTVIRGTVNAAGERAWMPDSVITPDGEMIVAYTSDFSGEDGENEIFVANWAPDADPANNTWDEFGRGATSNGNDVFGQWPNASVLPPGIESKMAMVDFSSNAEEDVMIAVPTATQNNDSHVYLFNRNTGTWTDSVDTVNFGQIFDLKGEPEIEFGVTGTPLLAFLDDTTGLPYVYKFAGGGWTKVWDGVSGNGEAHTDAAAAPIGNMYGTMYIGADGFPYQTNYGISVQAGPNGSILLAYISRDGEDNDYVVTQIWDGQSWIDAGDDGMLPMSGELSLKYYANFDGFDWDAFGDLGDGEVDQGGNHIHGGDWGQWWGWDDTNYDAMYAIQGQDPDFDMPDLVEWNTTDLGDPFGNFNVGGAAGYLQLTNNEIYDDGMGFTFLVPSGLPVEPNTDAEDPNDLPPPDALVNIQGVFGYQFSLQNEGDAVIELMYQMDAVTVANADVDLYLDIYSVNQDNTNNALLGSALIDSVAAGFTGQGYGTSETVSLDTKALGWSSFIAGDYNLELRAVVRQTGRDFIFEFDNDDEDWVHVNTSAYVEPGNPDPTVQPYGGWNTETFIDPDTGDQETESLLQLNFTSGDPVLGITGDSFAHDFTLGGPIEINFRYRIVTGALPEGVEAAVTLFAGIDGIALVEGGGAMDTPVDAQTDIEDSGWENVTITVDPDNNAAVYNAIMDGGRHVLQIGAILGGDIDAQVYFDDISIVGLQTATVNVDNVAIYQRIASQSEDAENAVDVTFNGADPGGWIYVDNNDALDEDTTTTLDDDTTGLAQAAWVNNVGVTGLAGDGAVVMTLGDGLTQFDDISGKFAYPFTTTQNGYLEVNLDYFIDLGTEIPLNEYLELDFYIAAQTDLTQPMSDVYTYTLTQGGDDAAWRDLESFGKMLFTNSGNRFNAGNYAVVVDATLSRAGNYTTYETGFNVDPLTDPALFDWELWDKVEANSSVSFLDDTDPANPITPDNPITMMIMHLGDGGLGGLQDISAFMSMPYTVTQNDDLAIEFKYKMLTGADTDLSGIEALDMNIYVDLNGNGIAEIGELAGTISSGIIEAGAQTGDWKRAVIDTSDALTSLNAGVTYTIFVEAKLSNTTNAGLDEAEVWLDYFVIYEKSANDDSTASVRIDTITVDAVDGYTDWEFYSAHGNNGSNNSVGNDRAPVNLEIIDDFQANIHIDLAAAGAHSYVVQDVAQNGYGDMWTKFRYRMTADNGTSTIQIVAVNQDTLEEYVFVQQETIDDASSQDWYYYIASSNTYRYTYGAWKVGSVPAGTYDIEYRLVNATGGGDLWMDNMCVVTTEASDAYKPIAFLAPTGQGGTRDFVVGVSNETVNLPLYYSGNTATDVAFILDSSLMPIDGYDEAHYAINVYRLESNEWTNYGNKMSSNSAADFSGINGRDGGHSYTTSMPTGENMYVLHDLSVGPKQYLWLATQHIGGDPVDVDDDNIVDYFDLHPYSVQNPPDYWNAGNPGTDLDIVVYRWNPLTLSSGYWEDAVFAPRTVDNINAYTHISMVSTPGLIPVVTYSMRSDSGNFMDGGGMIYEGANTWGVLGVSDSLQNEVLWGVILNNDIIVTADGDPIVSYFSGIGSYAIREFRPDAELPAMLVIEPSVQVDDDVLDFGILNTADGNQVQSFTVANNGPGDLVIYGIEIGGFGDAMPLDSVELVGTPTFPLTLEAGEDQAFYLQFDPLGVPVGKYDGIVLIQSNDYNHLSHPFELYDEISVRMEIESDAEIELQKSGRKYAQWILFDDAVIGAGGTGPEKLVLQNIGTDDLDIYEWLFDTDVFEITSAYISWRDNDGALQTQAVDLVNQTGTDDDVTLPNGYSLTFEILFDPDEVQAYEGTFIIHSSDTDESYVPVRLTGSGISGSDIEIYENTVLIPNMDGTIDFGSVRKGSFKDLTVTLKNTGSTPLTIIQIVQSDQDPSIQFDPGVIKDVVIAPGDTYDFDIRFTPVITADPEDFYELEAAFQIISDTAADDEQLITVALVGLGVPNLPRIELKDVDSGEALDRLDFGSVYVGQNSILSFDLTNVGGLNTTITHFAFGSYPTSYQTDPQNLINTDGDNFVISALTGSQTISVTFTPQTSGALNSQLYIYYLDQDGKSRSVRLPIIASGTNQQIEVTDSLHDSADRTLDYGNLAIGATNDEHYVTLTNNGDTALNITNWYLSGATDPVFTAEAFGGSDLALGAGESLNIPVTFAPTSVDSFSGTLVIETDDPNAALVVIALSGSGVEPGSVNVTPSTLDFGTLVYRSSTVKERKTETFRITNDLGDNLVIKAFASSSSLFIVETVNIDDDTDDIVLLPGQYYDVDVTFIALVPMFESTNNTITITTIDPVTQADATTSVSLLARTVIGAEVGGDTGSSSSVWLNDNGDTITVKLTGGGTASIFRDTNNNIDQIVLSGTTTRSSLSVSAKGGSAAIGNITGTALKNLTLKNVTLDGDLDNNGVEDYTYAIDLDMLAGSLKLNHVVDGADIAIAQTGSKGIAISAGHIGDNTDLTVNGIIKSLSVASMGDGSLTSDQVGTIKSNGNWLADATLDGELGSFKVGGTMFSGAIYVDGAIGSVSAPKADFSGVIAGDSIKSFKADSLENAIISAEGVIKKVALSGDMIDSHLLAGFGASGLDLGSNGMLGGGDDDLSLVAGGEISSVTIKGLYSGSYITAGVMPNAAGNFYVLSGSDPLYTRTGSIGTVKLGSVNTSNNLAIAAHTEIDRILAGKTTIDLGQTSWAGII